MGESEGCFEIASTDPYLLPELVSTSEFVSNPLKPCILSGLHDGRIITSTLSPDSVEHNEILFNHHNPISSIAHNKYTGLVWASANCDP